MDNQQVAVHPETWYTVECRDKDGNLKWVEEFHNLVTTAGLNALITAAFKTIPGSVAWYVGLKNTGSAAAGDTMSSHAGWTENTTYSESVRKTWTPGSVASGSVDNSASKATFSINGTTTIYGCFLASDSTKSGTTGTLYGVGDFASSRSVISGDTLTVQVTVSAS